MPIQMSKKPSPPECVCCTETYRMIVEDLVENPKFTDEHLQSLDGDPNIPEIFEFEDFKGLETPRLKEFREHNIIADNSYVAFILHLTKINHTLLKKLETIDEKVDSLLKRLNV